LYDGKSEYEQLQLSGSDAQFAKRYFTMIGGPLGVPWSRLSRTSQGWDCPHCKGRFHTKKRHYYKFHRFGQCLRTPEDSVEPEPQAFAFDDEEDSDPAQPLESTPACTIAAAVAAEQLEAAADLQQVCILAGLSAEQQQVIFSALDAYDAHIHSFIQSRVDAEPDDDDDDEEEEEDDANAATPKSAATVAAVKQQVTALKRAAEEPLYHAQGTAKISSLEANMELFAWRNEFGIKVRFTVPDLHQLRSRESTLHPVSHRLAVQGRLMTHVLPASAHWQHYRHQRVEWLLVAQTCGHVHPMLFHSNSPPFFTYVMQDRAMDSLLQLLLRILPQGSALAGSLYLLRALLDVARPAAYEHHLCPCERHFWPPLPKAQWSLTASNPCPQCNRPRFVASKTKPGKVILLGVVSTRAAPVPSQLPACCLFRDASVLLLIMCLLSDVLMAGKHAPPLCCVNTTFAEVLADGPL
jgi:hypothetical protein